MPSIYMSDKEYEALAYLVEVARNASDSAKSETYIKDFEDANNHFSNVERKYFKAISKQSSQKG
ncbi:hypothetical protein [Vibrio cholerae]|uniref:hypothetical protein n=1 Tax=Vibrio cholerae TaxID=666 RepID=UPI003080D98B